MSPSELWSFLPGGYLFTVAVETPVLLLGLAPPHPVRRRLFAGLWLTACTYPVVVLVLPLLIDMRDSRGLYLLVAETFAPLAECALFSAAFHAQRLVEPRARWRDWVAITAANLASFGLGLIVTASSSSSST